MASKQLGKLRQWAGEVISSKEKSSVTEEFRQLEKEIELRRDGIERLHSASELYHRTLSKKKDSEALDDAEKLLPIDTLGVVMIVHGEEIGEDNAFGASLVNLGRGHCKIATLQEAYALTFQDTFIASIDKFKDDIKEYEVQRKKLESRRLAYDAAQTKADKAKNSKKDKDKREAEEELLRAKQRFEETSQDVRAHMRAIQDNEIDQKRELEAFLDLELNFVEQYLGVLKEVKSNWIAGSPLRVEPRGELPDQIFTRPSKEPKFSSIRSKQSVISSQANGDVSHEDSDDGRKPSRPPSRKPSVVQRSETPKVPSRPSSRASRKRTDSTATNGDTDKEAEKPEKTRRKSVSGWASSAVGSVTGRGKKSKDKDKFSALTDDEEDRAFAKKSKENLSGSTPKIPPRPKPTQDKKVVRALYDFTGSSDELTFKTGDEITVIQEVLDEWWMGELRGRQGLFPTQYVELVTGSRSTPPPIPKRYAATNSSFASSDDEADQRTPGIGVGYEASDDEHGIGAGTAVSHRSPFYSGAADTASISSSIASEDESQGLMSDKAPQDEHDYLQAQARGRHLLQTLSASKPPLVTKSSTPDVAVGATSGKKPPPPPPPRRSTTASTTANLAIPAPPLPRRSSTAHSQSSGSLAPTPASSVSSHGYDVSPFESATEFTTTGCQDFKQNPFKPRGMCSNCFEYHT